ncbi:MAG: adaptor protein MecA [Clostridia bacterium]|nr:adaptor protein MecA [Clostridia bacterium]
MIIKKISDDQVKVLIESTDVNRYRIPYHKLSLQDDESMDFLYHLLFLIFEETGVSFLENAVTVEARLATGGNYFITFTRSEDEEGMLLQKEEQSEALYIFSPEHIEDIAGFVTALRRMPTLPSRCALYKWNREYYILLEYPDEPFKSNALTQLNEYASLCRDSSLLEGILCERGQLICPALPL